MKIAIKPRGRGNFKTSMLTVSACAVRDGDIISIGDKMFRVVGDVVQVRNPRTNRYAKLDRASAQLFPAKRTPGPYVGIPIVDPPKT